MELKPYQQQVINDLALFLENIQETKDVKDAFYNFWSKEPVICSTLSNKFESANIELIGNRFDNRFDDKTEFSSTLSNQLEETFFTISFSNHFLINKTQKQSDQISFGNRNKRRKRTQTLDTIKNH